MPYTKAVLIFRKTELRPDGVKLDMVIWQLPHPTPDRPHGLKYRLWAGREGATLVRYDNERGKGDHRHTPAGECPYVWRGMVALVEDFLSDVEVIK